ncbi:Actin-like protein arp9 (SWI/SNF complex component arp9) [Taxawa tesnikishii (nom. ined.)]|nr:Actin-like protein arp9 (SWI/SNF complex component arp9) [Dothideales sp. JES 119]
MPPFKDEQILIIAPGSKTCLAQLGLPESFTPARVRIRSCMFQAEKDGQYEPHKIRRRAKASANGAQETKPQANDDDDDDGYTYEEDFISEDGAIWPMVAGRIVDWPAFNALLNHIYNTINPPFHTPVLLIGQPAWTPKDHERVTQFFFEKFKIPAFGIMDAAMATAWAYGVQTATVVDVGYEKADVTAISDFLIHGTGRAIAVPECGGEAMTQRLLQLLGSKGFNREMCEQLKKSSICEVLPSETDLPTADSDAPPNPAALASTGMDGSGPGHKNSVATLSEVPRGPGPDTEVGTERKDGEDDEGVLDIASIVTAGKDKMDDFLAKKEKEKADRLAAKKKGADANATAPKLVRLPNSKRTKNTFLYEDFALRDALKEMNDNGKRMAEVQAAMDEGPNKRQKTPEPDDGDTTMTDAGASTTEASTQRGLIRRELEVGLERFQAASGGILAVLADSIHRTISSVEDVSKRSDLWDSLIIVGKGSKVRGFKEALLATLHNKYLISPSSATIFTSELPSNLSTPMATGANTPQPQMQPRTQNPHLNPLNNPNNANAMGSPFNPHNSGALPSTGSSQPGGTQTTTHSSHAQTPTSIRTAKIPDYFPEWKDVGYEEAVFLGAQVAARVLFVADNGLSGGYLTRTGYNEQGPTGIHECSL